MSLSLLGWNTANTSLMIICIQLPPRLPTMQEQKSLTCRWLSCSGWGRERVSLDIIYKGSRFTQKGQWCTKDNVLRFAVGYLNATINGKTRNTEQEIGTDGSSQTWQNLCVDWYGSGLGPARHRGPGFWMVREANLAVFAVQTLTAGRLPGPIATTTVEHIMWQH